MSPGSVIAVLGNGASNMVHHFCQAGMQATAIDPLYGRLQAHPWLITEMQKKMENSHKMFMYLAQIFYSDWQTNAFPLAECNSAFDYVTERFSQYFTYAQCSRSVELHISSNPGGQLPGISNAALQTALQRSMHRQQESFDEWLRDFQLHPQRYSSASSENLPLENGSVGCVFSWSCLYPHALQPGCEKLLHNSLQEIIRVLAPNGVFILGPLDSGELAQPIMRVLKKLHRDSHGDHSEDSRALTFHMSGFSDSGAFPKAIKLSSWPYPPS